MARNGSFLVASRGCFSWIYITRWPRLSTQNSLRKLAYMPRKGSFFWAMGRRGVLWLMS